MPRKRCGFTLLELVVVLSILFVTLSLLAAAVLNVRAAAARSLCANNLRQIGLAVQSYAADRGRLPAGVSGDGKGESYPRFGWHGRLLPYLDQAALWQEAEQDYTVRRWPFDNPPHRGLGRPVKVFGCPLDGRTHDTQGTHHGYRVGLTSYVGVLGAHFARLTGVLYVDSRLAMGDIADGASNTLLAGERPPSADHWYGWWYAGVGQLRTGSLDMVLGVRERNAGDDFVRRCPLGPHHFRPGRTDEQCDVFHYWSLHPGGAQFAFCDGSVRFLTYAADAVLPALATRSGGENGWLADP